MPALGLPDNWTLIFSRSAAMRAAGEVVREVARTDTTVLILGESGVGKDLVARAVHAASSRANGPFLKVNCAALPAELLESELFGHEKGAFTGAYRRKPGKFEFASKGTILLDEVGEMPRSLQAKLLHVLQDFEFARVGGRELLRMDARVIASTNRDLEAALLSGEFREDLYYRLNVVEILIPPLRERREEIPALAAHFLAKYNEQYGRNAELPAETMALFMRFSWPGNIRELENLIRRLVVLGSVRLLNDEIRARMSGSPSAAQAVSLPTDEGTPLGLKEIARRVARDAERRALAEVLERVHWNRSEAARILKVSYKTLLNKIAECGLANGNDRRQG